VHELGRRFRLAANALGNLDVASEMGMPRSSTGSVSAQRAQTADNARFQVPH
jgi:hypothetical protein